VGSPHAHRPSEPGMFSSSPRQNLSRSPRRNLRRLRRALRRALRCLPDRRAIILPQPSPATELSPLAPVLDANGVTQRSLGLPSVARAAPGSPGHREPSPVGAQQAAAVQRSQGWHPLIPRCLGRPSSRWDSVAPGHDVSPLQAVTWTPLMAARAVLRRCRNRCLTSGSRRDTTSITITTTIGQAVIKRRSGPAILEGIAAFAV